MLGLTGIEFHCRQFIESADGFVPYLGGCSLVTHCIPLAFLFPHQWIFPCGAPYRSLIRGGPSAESAGYRKPCAARGGFFSYRFS